MVQHQKSYSRSAILDQYFVWTVAAWTIIISGFMVAGMVQIDSVQKKMARNEALSNFKKDQAMRFWLTMHGGVYVPVSEKTQPNKYLEHVKYREIKRQDGQTLTLMNPAYVLRQAMENFSSLYGIRGHITSLKYFRPETKPDEWEKAALHKFKAGLKEFSEFTEIQGKPFFRYMAPMHVKEKCLKCHGHQGYKKGDVRGGLSVSVPLEHYLSNGSRQTRTYLFSLGLLWLCGFSGLIYARKIYKKKAGQLDEANEKLKSAHDELDKKVVDRTKELININKKLATEIKERKITEKELTRALENVKVLSGLVPICSKCKKIRDDRGYWNNLEEYIETHSLVSFSHGMCSECADSLYGENRWYKKMVKNRKKE